MSDPDLDTHFVGVSNSTIELFAKLFHDSIGGIYSQIQDRFQTIEATVEGVEKQLATLIAAYGEQAVFMEALVAQIAFATDDARKQFHDDINTARRLMLEVMRDAATGIMADEDPRLAATLGDVVDKKLSDTTE